MCACASPRVSLARVRVCVCACAHHASTRPPRQPARCLEEEAGAVAPAAAGRDGLVRRRCAGRAAVTASAAIVVVCCVLLLRPRSGAAICPRTASCARVPHAPAALRLAQASPAIPSDSARRALSAAEHRRTPSWLQRAPPPRARGEAAKRAPFCNPPARRRRSAGAAGGVLRARLRVAHAQTRRRSCMRAGAQRPARAARLTGQAPRCCCARPRSHEKPGAGGRGRMHTAASAASADDSQAHSLKEKAEREDKRSRSLRMQVPFVRVLVGDRQCTNSSPPSPFSCSLAFSLCRTVCPSLTLSLPHAHIHTHLPSLCRECVSLTLSLPDAHIHALSFCASRKLLARPPALSCSLALSLSLPLAVCVSLSALPLSLSLSLSRSLALSRSLLSL